MYSSKNIALLGLTITYKYINKLMLYSGGYHSYPLIKGTSILPSSIHSEGNDS